MTRRFLSAMLCCLLLAGGALAVDGPAAVTPRQLAGWLERDDPPLLLDVRGRAAYLEGTIPGALDAGTDPAGFLPDSRGGEAVLVVSPQQDPEPWRVRLADRGYAVYLLAGGLASWRGAGFPVETPAVSYTRPGTVPFVIPRGLCELNEPAETYD